MSEVPPPVRWWGSPLGEARVQLELAGLFASRTWWGTGVPRGDGSPVLLVPGFLAGDATLALLHGWLRRIGHRSYRSGITWNVDCSEAAVARLEERLAGVAERAGGPVALIGHSRGGLFARALSVRRPDLVRAVITLGSPIAGQLDASVLTLATVAGARAAQRVLYPGARPAGCLTLSCTCPYTREISAPAVPPLTAIWTGEDGIVRPSSCRRSDADDVEVRGSHLGLAVNAEVYRHVARVLAPA